MAEGSGVETTLTFEAAADVTQVDVVGSWDGWKEPVPMSSKGEAEGWEVTLLLPKGEVTFKFVADGVWMTGPSYPVVDDGFGGGNHCIVVVEATEVDGREGDEVEYGRDGNGVAGEGAVELESEGDGEGAAEEEAVEAEDGRGGNGAVQEGVVEVEDGSVVDEDVEKEAVEVVHERDADGASEVDDGKDVDEAVAKGVTDELRDYAKAASVDGENDADMSEEKVPNWAGSKQYGAGGAKSDTSAGRKGAKEDDNARVPNEQARARSKNGGKQDRKREPEQQKCVIC